MQGLRDFGHYIKLLFLKIKSAYPNREYRLAISDCLKMVGMDFIIFFVIELMLVPFFLRVNWSRLPNRNLELVFYQTLVIGTLTRVIFLEIVLTLSTRVWAQRKPALNEVNRKTRGSLTLPVLALVTYFAILIYLKRWF